MCGKNPFLSPMILRISGSPPRVREKHSIRYSAPNVHGITPACAGKTLAHLFAATAPWDHPRVCGKNVIPKQVSQERMGSPPRVREKLR